MPNNAAAAFASSSSSTSLQQSKNGNHPRFSRTKTGCFTCRSRRKKCDEERDPQSGACSRCVKSGIECLGYPALKSAPISAYRKRRAAQARQQNGSQASSDHQQGFSLDLIPPTINISNSQDASQIGTSQWQEEGVARWADLMALDEGEQLFYEGMFVDAAIREDPFSTLSSSRAISAEINQDIQNETPIQIVAEQFDASKQDDRALTCLSNFYAMFCWYRWQPTRRSYSKDQLALAIKKRLERSEILCISVAAIAACYGFGDFVAMPENSIKRSFLKHWNTTYRVVTSTKTRSLCAFLEWLGKTSSNGIAGHHHIATAETMRQSTVSSQGVNGEEVLQRDNLFSLAFRVLHEIAVAADQDQELPTNRSMPLDTAALVHVDKYLHAAMDLATFCYASRSANEFTMQFQSASLLLNSLLGRSQCVQLSELQGIDTTGFRSFAWADIINAVLTGRSTLLHYVSDQEAARLRSDPKVLNETDDDEQEGSEDENDRVESDNEDELQICFGCPDDVLVILASFATLHFQLSNARKSGSISGQGPEALPAWAVHAALDLQSRLDVSQKEADQRQLPGSRGKHTSIKTEHYSLGTVWRHAVMILLNSAIYRRGPLAAANQERLQSILGIWSEGVFKPMTIAMGDPAMPMLIAAFVAVSNADRKVCMEALQRIGQKEVGRNSYRLFIQKLWAKSDETGFGILWQDLAFDSEEPLAII